VEERLNTASILGENTFDMDTGDPERITMTMDTLTEEFYTSLVQEDLSFRTLTIKVRYKGFITRARACTLSHYNRKKETLQTRAYPILRDVMEFWKVCLLGIRLSLFEKEDARQMTLGL
jgi:DNA polymerase IV (archaeal DinB-like DNA polymerase)